MTERAASPHDSAKKDCGCGGGCGDCGDQKQVAEPSNRARRALMVGAGSVAFVATLANRRAFAGGVQCGPISHLLSLGPSQQAQTLCGGVTPGFWKNHKTCVTQTLGSDPGSTTLGSKLSNLATVDSTCANMTFTASLCNPSSPCNHWATAILNALSPTINPKFGYTITQLNMAILTAFNPPNNLTATQILDALKTLENDFGTNQSVPCAMGGAVHLCP